MQSILSLMAYTKSTHFFLTQRDLKEVRKKSAINVIISGLIESNYLKTNNCCLNFIE